MEVNNLSHEQLIKKIINQANSLNKKIKKFKEANIDEHLELVKGLFNDGQVEFNNSGSITKSKKFYDKQSDLWLKRTLTTLHKLNNHDVYGTINKYNKVATDSWNTLVHTVQDYLTNKGYDKQWVMEVTSTNEFYQKLLLAFKDNKKSYGSTQTIEKVFLEYANDDKMSEDEKKTTLNNIEHSLNAHEQILKEIRDYEEYRRFKGR